MELGLACALGLSREVGGAGCVWCVERRGGGSRCGREWVDWGDAEVEVVMRHRWEGPGIEGAGVDVGAVVVSLLQ